MWRAPTSTAPAASMRSIRVASRAAGGRSRLIFEPARVASPFTSKRFFTANGTPASGPTILPAAIAASTSLALARARSAVTSVKELRTASCCWMRASAASVASSAESFLELTAFAISAADCITVTTSGGEDTGRLSLIGQREFVNQSRLPQRYVEIGPDRRPPGFLDRQVKRVGEGVDVVVQCISSHLYPAWCTGNGGWGIAVSSSLV